MNTSKNNKACELEDECSQLKQQLLHKTVVLHTINEVIHQISQEVDLKKILNLVAKKAQQLIEADSLLIPVFNREQTQYTYMAATGKNAEKVLNQSFPKNMGMCGWVLSNEEILYFGQGSTHLMGRPSIWEPGMESALLVPLIARGKIVGGLSGLGKQDGKSFNKEDQDILQLFADHISIAIENAFIVNDLKLEKDRAETTLNSIGDAVITTDNKGRITKMNPIAEKITGWIEQEAIDLPLANILNIFNSQTDQAVQSPVEQVLSTGDIVELEHHTVLLTRDGDKHQIADSAAPIKDEDNKIVGVIVVFRDITEEHALQQALLNNQQRLQSILDNTPAVIYIKDLKGCYQLVNKQFEKLFNFSNENIHGLTDYDIFPEHVAEQFNKNDLEVIKGKKFIEVEESVPHEDGMHNYISVKFPLFDSDNNIYAGCGISTDITEHRKTEQALRRSQKMEAIGQLSGGIAHDFNNQLGVVIGYLDMLKQSLKDDPVQTKWLTTAAGATERCMDLTRQLLAFSSKKTPQTTNVNVNDSINEMQTVISRSLTPKIKVIYNFSQSIWLTNIDNGEFQDALLNLVLNAKDAMPDGGTLEIKTENIQLDKEQLASVPGAQSNQFIRISIQDSGSGMSPETMERAFEPFFTTKAAGKGTGLGMAMVYGFTKRQEGFVKIYSEPGLGTNIKLYLPRSQTTLMETEKTSTDLILPTGNETILIVDDETDLLHLAELYLNDIGYKTYKAKSAAEAMSILQKTNDIDLLFSDVVMPGNMNGYELAETAQQQFPELKILITSGFTSKNIQDSQILKYTGSLLNKPYRKEQLATRVREILDN